ncbi:MAG: nuclear transport factor 2 family protein [Solirubrobacterales bacterium]
MAAGDADTVSSAYDALNRGDVDAAMEALAEDAVWHESEALPDTGVYEGREAIRAFLTDFLASWERFHQTIEGTEQAGDKVAMLIHLEATGRGSAAEVDARYAHVWTMAGGRGIRVDAYYDREEALSAIAP